MTAVGRPTALIRELGPESFTTHLPTLMGIYAEAMGYPPQIVPARTSTAMQHAHLPGFTAFAAFDEPDQPVGFGYGYTTAEGQWWNTQVRRALGPTGAGWLEGSFELCELHVTPAYHRRGIGRRLLTAVTDAAGRPTARHTGTIVLSTPDGPTPARALYDSTGFLCLAESFFFPTDRRPFTVMGRPAVLPA